MDVTRSTLGAESSGYKVEHDGETYRFQVDGDTAVYVGEGEIPQAVVDELTKDRVSAVSYSGTVSGEIAGYVDEVSGGGGGVEVRSDDPSDPSAGEPWYNTTEDMLKVPYDDGGSVRVVEVRSAYSFNDSVFEDFEGASITDFNSFENGTTLSITQQNGSDRLEVDASGATSLANGGVILSEPHSKDVSATYYTDSEDGLAAIAFDEGTDALTYIAMVDLGGGFAGSPSVALSDSNQTTHKTVGITPSNWTGGDFQIRKYEDSNGDIVVEATDPDGNTVTTDPHTPSKAVYDGGVQVVAGNSGSNGAVVYVDDVSKKAVQEFSPQLDGYARDDTVPDAYINSGQGVVDNGSGLEVEESELDESSIDHDSLKNYSGEEHHPLFVDGTEPPASQDAIWVDTSQSPPRIKRFDGSSWVVIDEYVSSHDNSAHSETYALDSDIVDDHTNLTNVQTDQHHTRPSAGTGVTEDASNNFNVDEANVDHDSLQNYSADEHRPLLIDTIVDRPAAGTADRFFYATDEKILYHDNGASWDSVTIRDHANLSNVQADQHHTRPSAGNYISEDASNNFNVNAGNIDHDSLSNYLSEEHQTIFIKSESNRPSNPPEDTLFVDITNLRIERYTGSAWEIISTSDHEDLSNVNSDDHHTRPSAGTGLSEGASNNFRAGETPTDLSGTTGDFDGQIRIDDGTNTSNRGIMCVWDDTNSVWVPQDGGSTFT